MSELTTEHRGSWYDKDQTGAGFEIRILDNGAHFSEFFCGRVNGWFSHSVWFSIQGLPNASGELPLLLTTGAVLGEKHDLALAQAGTVHFDADGDTINATVHITSNGQDPFSPPTPPVTSTFVLTRLVG